MKRANKIAILAQICIDNNTNPQKGNYASLIHKVAVTHLDSSPAQAKQLLKALTTAYFTDRWCSLLNPTDAYDAPEPVDCAVEEVAVGFNTFKLQAETGNTEVTSATDQRALVHEELAKLSANTQPEPVKKAEAQPARQQDHLTERQIMQILYNKARRDTFNGVGRLFLCECREVADDKHMQISDVAELWRKHYPTCDVDWKSNVLLIYWDGKDAVQGNRERFVQPAARSFYADGKQGDIADDTFDEKAPEAKD